MEPTPVSYRSAGITIAGHLYTPASDGSGSLPAAVVGHPGSGVKEQAAGLYARLLAEQGFVTLAYDSAFQGESGGEPRGLEDPAHRIEDMKAGVSFLSTHPLVDPERIGILGICASGGYSLVTAASDHRIRAVATISGVDIARHFRLGPDGTADPAAFDSLLDRAAAARTARAHDEQPEGMRLFPDTIEQARAHAGEYAAEGFEYYCTPRGQHPRSAKTLDWTSIDKLATFDAFSPIPMIGQRPAMIIAGRRAVTSWMSVEAFQRLIGPKSFHWIEGASHNDLYDKLEYVGPAIELLTGFFGKNLAGR
ncbi:alpha/beta hydrolase [Dactylosporangium sp. NPDC048998]|uniref:alpha/beta hydrolase n=1 Tax=Dactylosporangium sp. NPDC048998 TaxID=3363976 RepID=UPI0037177409